MQRTREVASQMETVQQKPWVRRGLECPRKNEACVTRVEKASRGRERPEWFSTFMSGERFEQQKTTVWFTLFQGFPGGSVVKSPPASAGEAGLIPGSRRFPGGGNGNPLQYSCLANPMEGRVWWATVHGVTKEPDTAWQLNHHPLATECP